MVIDLNYYGAKAPNYINRGGFLSEVSFEEQSDEKSLFYIVT